MKYMLFVGYMIEIMVYDKHIKYVWQMWQNFKNPKCHIKIVANVKQLQSCSTQMLTIVVPSPSACDIDPETFATYKYHERNLSSREKRNHAIIGRVQLYAEIFFLI